MTFSEFMKWLPFLSTILHIKSPMDNWDPAHFEIASFDDSS